MKILFTGFTSRTIGSERNIYDYMSNVFVLEQALKLAGHEVDTRSVSLMEDPCIEEDYDAAVVGIAACQGLSSRFKLGALWALHKFGKRAAIFPSDGRNIYTFPSSVRTCLTGEHFNKVTNKQCTPVGYFLGELQQERNNVLDHELGATMPDVWTSVLQRLPHDERNPRCDWDVLVPTHSWGNREVYARHFGTQRLATWDPTNVAIPMQFKPDELAPDGRFPWAFNPCSSANPPAPETPWAPRERAWVISSLQDQGAWTKKQKCKWPVVTVGNKRLARQGEGVDYIPEREMIETYYQKYWGHLAFGYPLAEGGWWRMRYIHAGMAGIVTCCDENDARRMPEDYRHSRIMLERWSDDKLAEVAHNQWIQLMDSAWPAQQAVDTVDRFVKALVE